MIRTLGFLTGIVVTGTALALLTDPGVVRPALDSLAGSIGNPKMNRLQAGPRSRFRQHRPRGFCRLPG